MDESTDTQINSLEDSTLQMKAQELKAETDLLKKSNRLQSATSEEPLPLHCSVRLVLKQQGQGFTQCSPLQQHWVGQAAQEELRSPSTQIRELPTSITEKEMAIKQLKEDRQLNSDHRDANSQIQGLQEEIAALQRMKDELQHNLSGKEATLTALKDSYAKQTEEYEKVASELHDCQKKLYHSQEHVISTERQRAELAQQLVDKDALIKSLQDQLKDKQDNMFAGTAPSWLFNAGSAYERSRFTPTALSSITVLEEGELEASPPPIFPDCQTIEDYSGLSDGDSDDRTTKSVEISEDEEEEEMQQRRNAKHAWMTQHRRRKVGGKTRPRTYEQKSGDESIAAAQDKMRPRKRAKKILRHPPSGAKLPPGTVLPRQGKEEPPKCLVTFRIIETSQNLQTQGRGKGKKNEEPKTETNPQNPSYESDGSQESSVGDDVSSRSITPDSDRERSPSNDRHQGLEQQEIYRQNMPSSDGREEEIRGGDRELDNCLLAEDDMKTVDTVEDNEEKLDNSYDNSATVDRVPPEVLHNHNSQGDKTAEKVVAGTAMTEGKNVAKTTKTDEMLKGSRDEVYEDDMASMGPLETTEGAAMADWQRLGV
eukprot:TRINITY_DN66956_c10_g1_i2.p1 TRINITY_DN66956_c10_g1~~TRINITY_DN66956_c10_g1_i2.p1  ORF type:complete len:596 (-),score=81.70 TRINITY_DN66956_c10_g1_i2:949-2736(-)